MSELNGIYVDVNGDIKCRLGDSGYIPLTGIPTDDDYKVSLSVYDPCEKTIKNEISVQSDNEESINIPISIAFTSSLGVGRYIYAIKLTDSDGEEQTVIPKAIEDSVGNITISLPPAFIVKPLLVEGGTN